MIKKFAIALIAAVVLSAAISALMPRAWKVERSIVIAAPPSKIHPLIVDLKRWQDWSPWTRAFDSSLRNIFEGPSDGVGAKWSWLGTTMGRGTIVITEADEATGISLDESIESEIVNAHATIRYTREGENSTRVTWTDEGTLPMMTGPFLGTVEEKLAANFDNGLARLKSIAER